jgi:predicted nucleotidyltransferase
MDDIVFRQDEIAGVCRDLGVIRLSVFGSASRGEAGPDSDVDVAALFDREPGNLFGRYFELKEQLERILCRPVDLVLEDAIKNPYFRQAVDQTRVKVYGPGDEKIAL